MRKTVVKKIRLKATMALIEHEYRIAGAPWRRIFRRLKREYRRGKLAL